MTYAEDYYGLRDPRQEEHRRLGSPEHQQVLLPPTDRGAWDRTIEALRTGQVTLTQVRQIARRVYEPPPFERDMDLISSKGKRWPREILPVSAVDWSPPPILPGAEFNPWPAPRQPFISFA